MTHSTDDLLEDDVTEPRRSRRTETGAAASLFTIILCVGLLILGGLAVDGGFAIRAQLDAARTAEQAARAGADQGDTDSLRTGGNLVNSGEARRAAQRYLAQAGATGSVQVAGDEVTVRVTKKTKTVLLKLAGINGFNVTEEATSVSIDDEGR